MKNVTSILLTCSLVFVLSACTTEPQAAIETEELDATLDSPIIVTGQYGYSNEKNMIGITIDQSYENIPDQTLIEREVYFENTEQAWDMLGYETINFSLDDCLVNSGVATLIIEATELPNEVTLISVLENTEPICAFD